MTTLQEQAAKIHFKQTRNIIEAVSIAIGWQDAPSRAVDALIEQYAQLDEDLLSEGINDPNILKAVFLAGGPACIDGDTEILHSDGSSTKVRDLCEAGGPVDVVSLTTGGFESRVADCPYLKGKEDLYKVTLESGKEISVTGRHRFLTPSGWRTISQGGIHTVAVCADSRQKHSSSCQSTRPSNVLRLTDTGGDYQDDYRPESHFCDEQLHEIPGTCQASLPLQGGALERSPLSSISGGQGGEEECSRSYQPSVHRSKNCSSRGTCPKAGGQSPSLSSVAERSPQRHLEQFLSLPCSSFVPPSQGFSPCQEQFSAAGPSECSPLPGFLHGRPSFSGGSELSGVSGGTALLEMRSLPLEDRASPFHRVHDLSCSYFSVWEKVVKIENVGKGDFYDLCVPGPANYVANGMVHHNSGKTWVSENMFSGSGVKVVSSDDILTAFSKNPQFRAKFKEIADVKPGENLDLDKAVIMASPEIQKRLRPKAKQLTVDRMSVLIQGRLGLIIDGTAKRTDGITKAKKALEQAGYDTAMVFVDVPLDVALVRNTTRGREVPRDMLISAHKQIRANLDKMKALFGSNFYTIDNDDIKSGVTLIKTNDGGKVEIPNMDAAMIAMARKGKKILSAALSNPIGKEWIAVQKKLLSLASQKTKNESVYVSAILRA